MRMEKQNKAFAYRVPIGDYNYLQCTSFYYNHNKTNQKLTSQGKFVKRSFFTLGIKAKTWLEARFGIVFRNGPRYQIYGFSTKIDQFIM